VVVVGPVLRHNTILLIWFSSTDRKKRIKYRDMYKSGKNSQDLVGQMLDDIASSNESDRFSAFKDLLIETGMYTQSI